MKTKKLVWENRDRDLTRVKRFYDRKHRFEVMYYRTNLLVHIGRVEAIVETLIPLALKIYPDFDPVLARLLARHHDDLELLAGDTSLFIKQAMDSKQQSMFEYKEDEAMAALIAVYPLMIEGYCYKEILLLAKRKNSVEAQLVSFADKHDGYGESLHEVFAGNSVFLEPSLDYAIRFTDRHKKFTLIGEMFDPLYSSWSAFLDFQIGNCLPYFNGGKNQGMPYTKESIGNMTGIASYEAWKKITLSAFPNGIELLTKQQEFHTK